MNGDCYVWSDINLFEDIYLIKGSALQSSDLERARVSKATAVIILGKSYELSSGAVTQNNLDAETIFMYRQIEQHYRQPMIVTELASIGAITFLVQGKEENVQKDQFYQSVPFATGEIFVSNLLDSLMC